MTNQSTTITVAIREHRTDVLDEEGTVRRFATVTTRAEAQRWIQGELPKVSDTFDPVGEATEYKTDKHDDLVVVARAVWDYDQLDWFTV